MFTILGADGKEYGPVPAGRIQEWIAGGRANLQTKARRDGETEWKTLGDFAEFANAAAVPPPPAPTMAPGGAQDAVQPAGPVDAKAYADDLIARAAPLDVFGCLGRSFDLWKSNFLPLVGVTLVVFLVLAVLGMVPFLGFVANLVLTGVLYGGLYYYYLGKLRGEPREFGDAFAGFNRNFGGLVLANIFTVLISIAVACVLIAPWFIPIALMGKGTLGQNALLFIVPGMILCALPVIYLSVGWAFTFILVIDKGLPPWTAMEVSRRVITRQWFRVFFTALLGAILAMLGVIGLLIGVLFTLPLAVGAVVCAYEDLCNPPPRG